MSSGESGEERRQRDRFLVEPGAVVYKAGKPWPLADLGMGGLALLYEGTTAWPKDIFEVSILFANDDFYLDSILCETVADRKVSGRSDNSARRRHCVRFIDLMPQQILRLRQFLARHGTKLSGLAAA